MDSKIRPMESVLGANGLVTGVTKFGITLKIGKGVAVGVPDSGLGVLKWELELV